MFKLRKLEVSAPKNSRNHTWTKKIQLVIQKRFCPNSCVTKVARIKMQSISIWEMFKKLLDLFCGHASLIVVSHRRSSIDITIYLNLRDRQTSLFPLQSGKKREWQKTPTTCLLSNHFYGVVCNFQPLLPFSWPFQSLQKFKLKPW